MSERKKTFALIGAAGYVAPRHMKAIKDVGGDLLAAMDPNDAIGFMDRYFPDARFFNEFERFERFIDQCNRRGEPVNYMGIVSPDYLHDSHIRYALRAGADVLCEKPLVLNPWNLDGLQELEHETGRRVYVVLQLRLHPDIMKLREEMADDNKIHDVELTYITPRGRWFQISWKGDEGKSGGLATTIGIHFFDMMHLLFGKVSLNIVHVRDRQRVAGYMELERARVRWYLSIDRNDLPEGSAPDQPYRNIRLDKRAIEFSNGFTDLHSEVYRSVMEGRGLGIEEARPSIQIVSEIREHALQVNMGEPHPFARKYL